METKYYQYYQPNEKDVKDKYGDCVIRALTKALDMDWLDVFNELVPIAREMQAMPNMKSWSRLDAEVYFSLINMKVRFNNYGYVTQTNISPGNKLDISKTVEIDLEPKYKKVEEEIEDDIET